MKLLVLNDLHNEFSKFQPAVVDANVVVLAGDIDIEDSGLIWAREAWRDEQIIYVAGNHEYYGRDYFETLGRLRETASEQGIHLLENDEAVINGVRFLGATMWTDFKYCGEERKAAVMEEGRRQLNDFRLIKFGELGTFTPQHSIELHQKSLAWLTSKLDEPFEGQTVVVTHHLPSKKSVAERFADSPLSACFVSNLDQLFGKMALWIHGHTHENFDYVTNGIRVVCNPRGYVTPRGVENAGFNPTMVVEV